MGANKKEKDDLLIFMHVPKTAGTTLRAIVDKNFAPDRIYRTYSYATRHKKGELTNETECIQGHDIFGFHHSELDKSKSYTYMTMLRNPIDRVISEYNYMLLRNPRHDPYIGEKIKKDKMSLDDYVNCDDDAFLLRTVNMQTRFASGAISPDQTDLAKAKNNLSRYFSVVGITERFDKSLFLMNKAYGWKNIIYKKRNVADEHKEKNRISQKTIEKITEMNKLDIELYRWAKKKFRKTIEQLDSASKQEMEDFIAAVKRKQSP